METGDITEMLPIACRLPEQEFAGRRPAVAELFDQVEQVEELAGGYAFRFPAGEAWTDRLVEFIKFERRCCPFFRFELVFEPADGPLRLRISGGAGVKEFVACCFPMDME